MIQSRITSKAQTTVPRAVRIALGIESGDEVAWQIEGDRAVMKRIAKTPDRFSSDPFVNPFATFTEWADDLDSAYDDL